MRACEESIKDDATVVPNCIWMVRVLTEGSPGLASDPIQD